MSKDTKDGGDGASGPSSAKGALLVAAGILASRLMGLVRERVFAHYLGSSTSAAAFRAAMRIPNFLQTLLGEGVLSASFIPVYASLIGKGEREEADRLASAIFALLSAVVLGLVGAGLLFAPQLVDLIVGGFPDRTRELTITLVRILFPGTGFLVLSAWCLGILNSHRKFFLSYVAPVIWNAAIIGALLGFGGHTDLPRLAELAAWGTVAGGALQLGVQAPSVLGLIGRFRPALELARASVRAVLRSFFPVLLGRGVIQVSAFLDAWISSWLPERAMAALAYAQTLYLLPVSLFGMAVSAAELPAMSQVTGHAEEVSAKLRARIEAALGRILFFVVPSSVALLMLGDVIGAVLFQTGRFDGREARYLWYLLAGASIGLVATTTGRLYSSAFYALRDTRTPLVFAIARLVVSATLGYLGALRLPAALGVPGELGAVAILVASGIAAWIERTLLLRALEARIGPIGATGPARRRLLALHAAALGGGVLGLGVKLLLTRTFGADPAALGEWGGALLPAPHLQPIVAGVLVLGAFGAGYLAVATALGVEQVRELLVRVKRRLPGR